MCLFGQVLHFFVTFGGMGDMLAVVVVGFGAACPVVFFVVVVATLVVVRWWFQIYLFTCVSCPDVFGGSDY